MLQSLAYSSNYNTVDLCVCVCVINLAYEFLKILITSHVLKKPILCILCKICQLNITDSISML